MRSRRPTIYLHSPTEWTWTTTGRLHIRCISYLSLLSSWSQGTGLCEAWFAGGLKYNGNNRGGVLGVCEVLHIPGQSLGLVNRVYTYQVSAKSSSAPCPRSCHTLVDYPGGKSQGRDPTQDPGFPSLYRDPNRGLGPTTARGHYGPPGPAHRCGRYRAVESDREGRGQCSWEGF